MNLLPDRMDIRKVAQQAAAAMVDDLLTHLTEDSGLLGLDRLIREGALRLGQQVFVETIRRVGLNLRGAHQSGDLVATCDGCGDAMRFKQMRPVAVRGAITGTRVAIRSPYMRCRRCPEGQLPLQVLLGLDSEGFTPRLRELGVRAGIIEPFESAASDILKEFAGISLSGSKVHDLCAQAGTRAQELMDSDGFGEVKPLSAGDHLYVQIDGGMLHVGGDWKEAKLAVVFPHDGIADISKDRRALTERHSVATFGTRIELGQMVYNIAERYLPKDADERPIIRGNVTVLGDGAAWITNLVDEHLPGADFLLDWYHVADHVGETARILFENDKGRQWWRKRLMNRLKAGFIDAALDSLTNKLTSYTEGTAEHDAVFGLRRYLTARKEQLWYAKARRAGRYIGSGVIESANNYVLQQRMKRAGMRWMPEGATAMAVLRCTYRSTGGMKTLFAAA